MTDALSETCSSKHTLAPSTGESYQTGGGGDDGGDGGGGGGGGTFYLMTAV